MLGWGGGKDKATPLSAGQQSVPLCGPPAALHSPLAPSLPASSLHVCQARPPLAPSSSHFLQSEAQPVQGTQGVGPTLAVLWPAVSQGTR